MSSKARARAKLVVSTQGLITADNLAPGAAVPDQTGNSGKFLTTNGTTASWGTVDLTTKADKTGGNASGTWPISVTGNAATATKLQTARSISLTGDVSGSVSFDGSADASITAVVADDSHNHSISTVTGLQTALDGKQPLDGDLTAIAALAGTSGLLKKTAADTWTLDTAAYSTTTGTVTSVGGTGGYGGLSLSGTVTSSGNLTLGGTPTGTWPISVSGNAATATSADQIDGWGFRNTGSNSGVNADTIDSNGITYYTSGVPNFTGNSTDGALYSQAYSSSWQHQIAADYRSGQIALRGKNSGTWQGWRTVLDSGNYTSYRGTQLVSPNGATVVAADSAMPDAGHSFIHTLGLGPSGNDGHILGMTWANTTSVYGAQIWVDTDPNNRMAFRSRSSTGAWTGWNEVIHSSNYNAYSPTLTGGGASGTWGISISGNAATASNGGVTSVNGMTGAVTVGGVAAGAVMMFAQSTAPSGWLKANGAAVSRSTYSALFSAIGTTYGAGNGSTTFNLPDLRGQFMRGWDDGRGLDSGRAFGSTQTDAVVDHKHYQGAGEEFPILGYYGNTTWRNNSSTAGAPRLAWTSGVFNTSGVAAGATETRPDNVALLACIKY